MGRVVWVDATAGVAGDMLAGALVDAGVPIGIMADAVRAVIPDAALSVRRVERAGLAASKFDVEAAETQPHRHLSDIRALFRQSGLDDDLQSMVDAVFVRLADVEAAAHGVEREQVHFHEVGAVDAIADIVSVCAGLQFLGCDELRFGTIELGTGTVRAEHGELPVPTPAAVRLSEGLTVAASAPGECATPTGLALLTSLGRQVIEWGPMTIVASGNGAGRRDRRDRANIVRVIVGSADDTDARVLAEANIDDMDPRLWPRVLELLMSDGADDVWLTPITMKKGRPAHTLSVLCRKSALARLQEVVFEHTTTIGMRVLDVEKVALERATETVDVRGVPVRIKIAGRMNRILNVSVEFDDAAHAARTLQQSEREVLVAAQEAAAAAGFSAGQHYEFD